METKYNKELSVGIASLLAGVAFLCVSAFIWFYMIPYTIKGKTGGGNIANNPTIFPKLFTICLAATALILTIIGICECVKYRQYLIAENIKIELTRLFLIDSQALVVFAIISVIFCIIAPILGFFISGFFAVAAAAYYLGNRGFVWVIVFPAVFTVLLWFVFSVLLSVRFPAGILF